MNMEGINCARTCVEIDPKYIASDMEGNTASRDTINKFKWKFILQRITYNECTRQKVKNKEYIHCKKELNKEIHYSIPRIYHTQEHIVKDFNLKEAHGRISQPIRRVIQQRIVRKRVTIHKQVI